ncbi:MAG: nucleotide exchange factor GrpE [Alphaproteobacteria bacterium]|nr:nucleotide exchange factor GrpE [Alphaproteobacteria bacterium]
MVHSKIHDENENGSLTEDSTTEESSGISKPAEVEENLQETVQQLKDQLLRALAETENVRKRAVREREEALQYAVTSFAKDLLGVADNLRRALEALPAEKEESLPVELKGMIDGVKLTEKELLSAFEKHKIQKINPLNEKFDHTYHQAMFETENDDAPAGTIVEVLQSGYVLNNRLLRPAMVGVTKPVSK